MWAGSSRIMTSVSWGVSLQMGRAGAGAALLSLMTLCFPMETNLMKLTKAAAIMMPCPALLYPA